MSQDPADRRNPPLPSGVPLEDPTEITMKLSLPRVRGFPRVAIPTLRVVAGPDMLRFASIGPRETLLVGRDEAAGLVLTDASVSRNHVLLLSDGDAEVTVQDLGSTNGTAVNGQQISRALLRPGDHLEVGTVSLRLDLLGDEELAHLQRVESRLKAADRDKLTGLRTRDFMSDELPQLLADADESGTPVAMIFADVDHFKTINDTWGHAVGDEVLSGISRLFMLGIRDSDHAVRWGGEEMAIILPGSDTVGAVEVAERLRRAISGHDWGRTAGGLKVTVSFGVSVRASSEAQKPWFERADRALYRAKSEGRNRVVAAT